MRDIEVTEQDVKQRRKLSSDEKGVDHHDEIETQDS